MMQIPADLLSGKRVLVGVTGSIAVYKSLELVRHFIKAGAEVKVVMSDAAKKFVTPLSFETLSRHQVLDEASESWWSEHNHIQTGEWADLFVIAPCTANTLNKLAGGIADNMLLQTALAYPGITLLAPSANTNMLYNPITEASLTILRRANYRLVGTQTKELACQTVGDGAMADPLEIFWQSARILLGDSFWQDRRVIVTGGGTVEKIDDVRYISNFSSGKMASALAAALYLKGADVTLIATRKEPALPLDIHIRDVESSEQMLERLNDAVSHAKKGKMVPESSATDASLELIQKTPYLFMAAAVSDYVPGAAREGKLKKTTIGERWSLDLRQNVDILSSVDKTGMVTVAFKAEMDSATAVKHASAMIDKKAVDAVCLNLLADSNSFGTPDNQIDFITAREVHSLPKADKLSLSLKVIRHAQEL